MSADYIRRCPTCGTENAPSGMRCACGALLAGVDPVIKKSKSDSDDVPLRKSAPVQSVTCPFPDCEQPNSPESETCVYCDRPLKIKAMTPPQELHSLLRLPSKLNARYRIVRPLPAGGAEAELLVVEALTGGPSLIAKIYRHGIQPDRNVLARIVKIAPEHRVKVYEADISDGYAYELMEYCALGSWRDRMLRGPLPDSLQIMLVRELSIAIAGVHAAGLVHRDLKPENILVRSEQPYDLVLTDFSISSIINATQCFTSTARTLNYASPESLSGVLDGKADYWSLGMIVLESVTGRHPFAGLSEAVILHHLTTRNVDVSGVADPGFRKLLRGLLLRDPKERWGANEVGRWLAGDASLQEPAEQHRMGGFLAPYHVGNEVCHTPEQLAVAFTQNWNEGAADIANGQLLAWFRSVQKDQNVVRLLIDMRQQRALSVDVQLLRLILHLAPGIPLVWCGEPADTRAILSRANLALQGDTDAARWLDMIYQLHVLDIYADEGNPEAENLVQKWSQAGRQFERAWDEKHALVTGGAPAPVTDECVNIDALMFGNSRMEQPRLSGMHAQLLALAFDVKWAERMRQRLMVELANLSIQCPALTEMGDPRTMDAASLLVVDTLLPEARKIAEQQIKAKEQERDKQIGERNRIQAGVNAVIVSLRGLTKNRMATLPVCTEIKQLIGEYHDLVAVARSENQADPAWREISRSTLRHLRNIDRLMLLVDELIERRPVDAGFFNQRVAVFAAVALLMRFIFFRDSNLLTFGMLAAIGGVAAWRLLPTWSLMRQIRELGGKL